MERLVFRYLTGSKANQIEQVPLEGVIELLIGRDPNAAIVFDPDKDDLVSRQHAVIRVKDTVKLAFSIADLQSTNGTFLNGERILAEQELLPGDSIEFGHGGPKMVFDVEPRPAHLVERTRIIPNATFKETKMSDGPKAPATSVHTATGASATTVGSGSTVIPPKVGIGRETLERELSKERKASGQKWMIASAAALLIVGVVGGVLYYRNMQTETALKEQVAAAEKKAEANVAAVKSQVEGMTPKQVAAQYGDATVFIEASWNLFDKLTSKQVFLKTVGGPDVAFVDDDKKLQAVPAGTPAYVLRDNGEIVRWLVTESEELQNQAISSWGQGSGFVVTPDGSILTNKHVASSWLMEYQSDFGESKYGAVFKEGTKAFVTKKTRDGIITVLNAQVLPIAAIANSGQLRPWIPANLNISTANRDTAPRLFLTDRPQSQSGVFEAKEEITVTFPGTKLGVVARFLRASQENDAALIKIDVPGNTPLKTVEMAAPGTHASLGEPVTVIGYPALSENRAAILQSREHLGSQEKIIAVIPEPTVTEGIIAKYVEREAQGVDSSKIYGSGDYYQLTINSTGHGNSGGPVFDSNGKVIGLFTYSIPGAQGERASASAAVPISFGQDLLQLSRVTSR